MEFCVLRKSKITPARNYDLYYDKTIAVAGARDYYREASIAISNGTEYTLCPNFSTMFSDNRPRYSMRVKTYGKIPVLYEEWREAHERVGMPVRPFDIQGFHRSLFFKQPTQPYLHPAPTFFVRLQTTQVAPQTLPSGEGLYPQSRVPLRSIMRRRRVSLPAPPPSGKVVAVSKGTQTDYRESETQTLPWACDFVCLGGQDAELFTLDWFKWEQNVPIGEHEVTLIERGRQRQAWESAFPVVTDQKTDIRRKSLVAMMETNDTAFRESELESIHELRIELSKEKLYGDKEKLMVQLKDRMERMRKWRREENLEKLDYMQHQRLRSLRKLNMERKKISKKYCKWDIVSLHHDRTSELYAPQLRFGEDPSRRHETIDIQCRFLKRYRGFELLEERASREPRTKTASFDYNKALKPKVGGCARSTTWTEEGLQILHSELKAIRSKRAEPPLTEEAPLRQRLPTPGAPSPCVSELPEHQEEAFQAALMLSKILKGRATQSRFLTEVLQQRQKGRDLQKPKST